MKKIDKLIAGKVYRWRCPLRGNDIERCSKCDHKFPRSYTLLETHDGTWWTEAHKVRCGDYVVFLEKTGRESIKVITMVENFRAGDMLYGGSNTGKLFLVKNL